MERPLTIVYRIRRSAVPVQVPPEEPSSQATQDETDRMKPKLRQPWWLRRCNHGELMGMGSLFGAAP